MILYKYCKPDEKTIKIINSNEFWFATPNTFNDPFDGLISLPKNTAFGNLTQHIYSNLKSGNPYGDQEYGEYLHKLNREIGSKKLINKIYTDEEYGEIENIIKSKGILSLSENSLNSLMWSHYSSNHTGVCIGIEIDTITVGNNYFEKIEYKDDRPILDVYNKNDELNIKNALFTKHVDRAYEKEWRLITKKIIPNQKGELILLPGKITEINLGISTKNNFIELVKKMDLKNIQLNMISHNYFDFKLKKIPI